MPDPSFIFAQSVSGLTAAMFLFLIASGLSLIFGVLRVLNFAHGTFYMLGAYAAFQFMLWLGPGRGRFWLAALGAAAAVAVLGGLIERFLFRRLYGAEELYQLLFTYALVLVLGDATKMLWGTQQKSVSLPPELGGKPLSLLGATIPHYNLFIILLGPLIALVFAQIIAKRFHPSLYWATIVASTTFGTTMADFADRSLGIGYTGGSAVLLCCLTATRRLVLVGGHDLGQHRAHSHAEPAGQARRSLHSGISGAGPAARRGDADHRGGAPGLPRRLRPTRHGPGPDRPQNQARAVIFSSGCVF